MSWNKSKAGRAYARKWRIENKEWTSNYDRQWRLKQPAGAIYQNSKETIESCWESFVKYKIRAAKNTAKRHDREFSITYEYIMAILVKQEYKCKILKCPLEHIMDSPSSLSIDRVDSAKGYIEGNIQLLSAFANLGKNKYSQKIIETKIRL